MLKLAILLIVVSTASVATVIYHRKVLSSAQQQWANYAFPTHATIFAEPGAFEFNHLFAQPAMYDNLGGNAWRVDPPYLEDFPVRQISGAKLFIHCLRNKGGNVRLVFIAIRDVRGDEGYSRYLQWEVVQPGSFWRDPRVVASVPNWGWLVSQGKSPIQAYAGQADISDLSHGSFEYVENFNTKTIDFYLLDDDSLAFVNRVSQPLPTTQSSR